MSGITLKPSQRVSVVGSIDPQPANAMQASAWIDAAVFHNFLSIVKVGVLAAGATVDARIQQATSNGGANVKDVPGRAITQLTKAGGDDNRQVQINLKQDDLDFNAGFRWFRLAITPAGGSSMIDGTIYGLDPRFGFAVDNDAASVKETVG